MVARLQIWRTSSDTVRDADGTLTSGTEHEVVDMASFGADLRQIALAGPDVLYVAVNGVSGGATGPSSARAT